MSDKQTGDRCPNSADGKHNFYVEGKNKKTAEKYRQVACKYCNRLVPHGKPQPPESEHE